MQLVCLVLMGNNQPKMTPLFLVLVLGMVGIGVCQTTTIDVTTPLTATTNNDTTILTMETSMIATTDVITETDKTSAVPGTTKLPVTTGTTKLPVTTDMTMGPSTERPAPKPGPPTGTWIVKNDAGAVCMKMRFGARLEIVFTNTSFKDDKAIIDAPATAFPEGLCQNDEPRVFNLHFFNNGEPQYFFINLTFSKADSKFSMTEVGNYVTIDNNHFKNPLFHMVSWSSSTTNNFLNISVPLGKSFNCKHSVEIKAVSLTLTDVLFQPFAEEAQGGFGESIDCDHNQSNNNNALVITIAVISVIILLSVTSCIAVFIVKKRRKSRPEDLEHLTN